MNLPAGVVETVHQVVPVKSRLALYAVAKHKVTGFADIGGAWGVGSAYTFDIVKKFPDVRRAYIVDNLRSERVLAGVEKHPKVTPIFGFFGDSAVAERVRDVDALIMFDILLHQANPNWIEILKLWAPKARTLIVYNQMWTDGDKSIRFIERGADWYAGLVRTEAERERIYAWFARHGQIDRHTGQPVEDQYRYSQWGITRKDLLDTMQHLGFRLDFFEDHGQFRSVTSPCMRNQGFIFVRDGVGE